MSILESQSSKELRDMGKQNTLAEEKAWSITNIHPIQILLEENMVVGILTNHIFFFARDVTVYMPYYFIQFQWVVLAFDAHSLEVGLIVGTSMEAMMTFSVLGCEIWTFNLPRCILTPCNDSAPRININFMIESCPDIG